MCEGSVVSPLPSHTLTRSDTHNDGKYSPLHTSGDHTDTHNDGEYSPLHTSGDHTDAHNDGEYPPLHTSGDHTDTHNDGDCLPHKGNTHQYYKTFLLKLEY